MDDRIPPLSFAPDGLYEADVDALLAEYFGPDFDQAEEMAAPFTVADRASGHRHARRADRQAVRVALRSVRVSSPRNTGKAA